MDFDPDEELLTEVDAAVLELRQRHAPEVETKLIKLIMNYDEGFWEEIQELGEDDDPIVLYNTGLFVKCVHEEGGEGDGAPMSNIVMIFEDQDPISAFRITGTYSSWDSTQWDEGFTLVHRRQVVVGKWIACDGSEDGEYDRVLSPGSIFT